MNLQITSRKINLNQDRLNYIENTILGLEKYNLNIQKIQVVLTIQHNILKSEMIIEIPGYSRFVFHSSDEDFYTSIASCYQRAEKSLRRFHDRKISKKRQRTKFSTIVDTLTQSLEDIQDSH